MGMLMGTGRGWGQLYRGWHGDGISEDGDKILKAVGTGWGCG